MGYTHYWDESQEPATPDSVERFKEIFFTFLNLRPNLVTVDWLNDEGIAFNGKGEDGHETMVIPFQGEGSWRFCKTAMKPYDEIVVASLVAADSLGLIDGWSSDGGRQDHAAGNALFNEAIAHLKV